MHWLKASMSSSVDCAFVQALLYTAVTRARQAVYVVGSRSAFEYAVKNDSVGT